MTSTQIFPLIAALIYIPVLTIQIYNKRSWIDLLVVGIIAVILATTFNNYFPPWGTVGFVIVHMLLAIVTIVKRNEEQTKKN